MKKIILDNKYELGGGLGCWACSIENSVSVGEVRVIGDVLMYAYTIYFKKWQKNMVKWIPVDKEFNTFENLRTWINK